MATSLGLRCLELTFFLYFFTHIPISILFDSQILLPEWIYPKAALDATEWYARTFKDCFIHDGPAWYKACVVAEQVLQIPFFFFAAYAFFKGNCPWIRIPAIVYSTHVVTTVSYILTEFLYGDLSNVSTKYECPSTQSERWTLSLFFWPYLILPLMILITMLFSKKYSDPSKKTNLYRDIKQHQLLKMK